MTTSTARAARRALIQRARDDLAQRRYVPVTLRLPELDHYAHVFLDLSTPREDRELVAWLIIETAQAERTAALRRMTGQRPHRTRAG